MLAVLLLASGATGLWQLTKRDSSGFFTTNSTTLSTNSYAITSDTLDVGPETPRLFGDHLGTVQIRVSSDKPVFVGIAPTSDVERYLARVDHQSVTDFEFDPFSVEYADRPGPPDPRRRPRRASGASRPPAQAPRRSAGRSRRATGRPWR